MSTASPARVVARARAAVVGTVGAVAVVVTSAVVLGAGVGPLPDAPLPQPIMVDADPGLPSDEEPPEGWPAPPAVVDRAPEGGKGPHQPADGPTDPADGLTDTTEGATAPPTEPLTDPVHDVVEGVTGSIEDAVDEVTDTIEEAEDSVGEATDTLDELP